MKEKIRCEIKNNTKIGALLVSTCFLLSACGATVHSKRTVPPEKEGQLMGKNAARSLLKYLNDITGENILSGQESMFSDGYGFPSKRDAHVFSVTNKYPALYSSDFGDVREDNLHNRQTVVDNAIAYGAKGSLIQLHNHMVQPDLPDGSGFDAMSGFKGDYPYMNEILEGGSKYNAEHMRRLDELADYLQQLRDTGVAVLWRPYHEMNGGWFWWGKQSRYKELWIQQWEYFTLERHLTNLVWVWSPNHFGPEENIEMYYPGHEYVDVLGVDIYLKYGHNYDQYVHDALLELGGGKPIAITENGEMPNIPKIKEAQPNWVYWSTWWGFEGANEQNTDALYKANYGDAHVLTQDEVTIPNKK